MAKRDVLLGINTGLIDTPASSAAVASTGLAGTPGSGTLVNADTVDGYHASSTPTAGYLLALNAQAEIPYQALPNKTARDWRLVSGASLLAYSGDLSGLTASIDGESGDAWFAGDLEADGSLAAGDATLEDVSTASLAVSGAGTIGGTLRVSGAVTLAAALSVAGLASLARVKASGAVQLLSTLSVLGAASIANELTVTRKGRQLRLAYDASNYANLEVGAGGSLVVRPTGDLILDTGDVLPQSPYQTNLGALNRKFLGLYAAELWVETLVAQDTMATMGGRVLVGPTTILQGDVSASDTVIVVKHNNLAVNDIVYLEADGQVEFMRITGATTASTQPADATTLLAWAASAVGPGYAYTVQRNLDGSGANVWSRGAAVFNTGGSSAGAGFIDLYSIRGVKSASQAGPTIVGNVRKDSGAGAVYNNWTERWAIGNLAGLYGYGSTTYGAAFGEYAAGRSWLAVDSTNGIRMMHGTSVVRGQWAIDGSLTIGQVASGLGNIHITSAGALQVRVNTSVYLTLSASGIVVKNSTSTQRIELNSSGLYGYDSDGTQQFYIQSSDGKGYFGGGVGCVDADGFRITATTADEYGNVAAPRLIRFIGPSGSILSMGSFYQTGIPTLSRNSTIQSRSESSGGSSFFDIESLAKSSSLARLELKAKNNSANVSIRLDTSLGITMLGADLDISGRFYPGTGSTTQASHYLIGNSTGIFTNGGFKVGSTGSKRGSKLDVAWAGSGNADIFLGDWTNGWALGETSNVYLHFYSTQNGDLNMTSRFRIRPDGTLESNQGYFPSGQTTHQIRADSNGLILDKLRFHWHQATDSKRLIQFFIGDSNLGGPGLFWVFFNGRQDAIRRAAVGLLSVIRRWNQVEAQLTQVVNQNATLVLGVVTHSESSITCFISISEGGTNPSGWEELWQLRACGELRGVTNFGVAFPTL